MASDDLARLRAMVEAMTGGEWTSGEDGVRLSEGGFQNHGGPLVEAWSYADCEGIAVLRNVAPELLAVAEAVQDMREGINDMEDVYEVLDALRAKLREVL